MAVTVTVSRMNKNVTGGRNGYNLAFQVSARINKNAALNFTKIFAKRE